MADFEAQVRAIVERQKERMRRVAAMSIGDVLEAAQTEATGKTLGGVLQPGKIPILTRELVESLESSSSSQSAVMGRDSFRVVTDSLRLGDVLRFEWTAPYSYMVHEGYTDFDGEVTFQGDGWQWVGVNAPRFSGFVESNSSGV